MAEIFPVIHVNDIMQAQEQADIAFSYDVAGVYLIQHHGDNRMLFDAYNQVRSEFPDHFIGMNILGSTVGNAYKMIAANCSQAPDGLWVDDITDGNDNDASAYTRLRRLRSEVSEDPVLRSIKLLGGISFKYTARYSDSGPETAREVLKWNEFVDVVTTSGPGTNREPLPEKLQAIRTVTNKPIAVASGISAENIYKFNGLVDQVLVASSIETMPYSGEFIPEKIAELVDAARV